MDAFAHPFQTAFDHLRLNRRQALRLAGGAAALLRSPGRAKASAHMQIDWPTSVGQHLIDLPPGYTYGGARYTLNPDSRRETLIMNADPLLGVEDQWNASGSSSFVRPADSPLGWDRIIYVQLDTFASQDAVATYLNTAQGALEPYSPLPITLPESGMPANAFASRVSYPYPNDPTITIDRIIFGGRRRTDGFLITFDGYDSPFPDDEIIDISRATSRTYGELFNTEAPPLIDVPFFGRPQEVEFFWEMYADEAVRRYADGDEDVENRATFNDGAANGWSAFHTARSERLNADFVVYTNGWGFETNAAAETFFEDLPARLEVSDQRNNVFRLFLDPVPPQGARVARVNVFNWEVGEGQTLPGIAYQQQIGRRILEHAFISTQPFPASAVPDPGSPDWVVVAGAGNQEEQVQTFDNMMLNVARPTPTPESNLHNHFSFGYYAPLP